MMETLAALLGGQVEVPEMQWEAELRAAVAVSRDQLRFVLALFASVLVGVGMRFLSDRRGEREG